MQPRNPHYKVSACNSCDGGTKKNNNDCYPPSPRGTPKTSDQSVAKAIPQIPRGNSLRQHPREPVLYLLYCTLLFVTGRVERLEFG